MHVPAVNSPVCPCSLTSQPSTFGSSSGFSQHQLDLMLMHPPIHKWNLTWLKAMSQHSCFTIKVQMSKKHQMKCKIFPVLQMLTLYGNSASSTQGYQPAFYSVQTIDRAKPTAWVYWIISICSLLSRWDTYFLVALTIQCTQWTQQVNVQDIGLLNTCI